MTSTTPTRTDATYGDTQPRRLTTETKAAFKTTEFIVYVLMVVGVLIAAAVTDTADDHQGFSAQAAWLYVTLLTIGYMVSRGLAKSGSREHYDA
ncbi:MAG: hypothetical protein JWP61_2713 [Friedmanniella sp.]|nr:hypothetical protein [Friedmanniella sp.]